jgi:hypothetical protein
MQLLSKIIRNAQNLASKRPSETDFLLSDGLLSNSTGFQGKAILAYGASGILLH